MRDNRMYKITTTKGIKIGNVEKENEIKKCVNDYLKHQSKEGLKWQITEMINKAEAIEVIVEIG